MKRLLRTVGTLLSSRLTSPVVIGIFLVVYIAIAFFTEDALIAEMELTRQSVILLFLLSLLPLSVLGRIVSEAFDFIKLQRTMAGNVTELKPELFNETVELTALSPDFLKLQHKLEAQGYRTIQREKILGVWRGIRIFPARQLFLAGLFCLFFGILISLVTRSSYRGPVVEGERFPSPSGNGGIVEQIRLKTSTGRILSKELTMEVAPSAQGDPRTVCVIYPPTRYQGSFIYPRFLGVALTVQFSAPDLQSVFNKHVVLNIYPAGKEAPLEIPGSPYHLVLSMAIPDDGSDPFITGRMNFRFKLMKDKETLFTEVVPGKGEFARDGYRLAFPDFRRMVLTDFIQDNGVLLIWTSFVLFGISILIWLPVCLFFPRREMYFIRQGEDVILACSRAEGKERRHGGIFNEALDQISNHS